VSERVRAWVPSVMLASSIALLVLLPIQIVSWLIASDPTEHTTQWVADRWANSAWRAVDWMFLVVALIHGGLGASRWLMVDHGASRVRVVALGFVVSACVALLALGSYTFFSYELT
jgi:succinate dehydrogenase hydrophobic anchor subunit